MSASPTFSFIRKPLSVTVRFSNPPRSYTLTQLPLLLLSAAVVLLLLYLMVPPWLMRLARNLTLLAGSVSAAYFIYSRFLSKSDGRRKQAIFPSVYEAPGGIKSAAISWTVDPAEQERINKVRGTNIAISHKRLESVLEDEQRRANGGGRPHGERDECKTNDDVDEKARRALAYSRVHGELLHTERTYTAALQSCVDVYIQPMQERCNSGALRLSQQEMSTLFSNLTAILSFHLLLQADLTQASSDNVGAVFVKYADYLKMYSVYVSNYSACLALVSRLSMQRDFDKFLSAARSSRASAGLDLMSYLIQPIQRIPRYEMLLTQLVKSAPYPSCTASLSAALAKVHGIAVLVNERKREAENGSFILELQHRIHGRDVKESLLQPSRKLVRMAELDVRRDGKSRCKRLLWLLLSDVLLVCRDDYEWKEEIRARDVVRIDDLPPSAPPTPVSTTGKGKAAETGGLGELTVVYHDGKGREQRMAAIISDDETKQSWLCSLRQFQAAAAATGAAAVATE